MSSVYLTETLVATKNSIESSNKDTYHDGLLASCTLSESQGKVAYCLGHTLDLDALIVCERVVLSHQWQEIEKRDVSWLFLYKVFLQ